MNSGRLLQSLAILGTLTSVVAANGPQIPIVRVRVRPDGPPSRSSEEARRRKQMAARGLPVAEPAPVDDGACVGAEEGGVA